MSRLLGDRARAGVLVSRRRAAAWQRPTGRSCEADTESPDVCVEPRGGEGTFPGPGLAALLA